MATIAGAHRPSIRRIGLAVTALAVLVAAGCSSNNSNSSGSSSTPGSGGAPSSSSANSALAETIAKASQRPTDLGLPPLPAKPAAGKKIIYLRCSQPVCRTSGDDVKKAGESLGWTVSFIDFPPDPAGTNEAFGRALDQHPDGIILDGTPVALLQQSMKRAKSMHIPVILGYVLDQAQGTSGNGLAGVVAGKDTYTYEGTLGADWVANDSKGKANVALFNVSAFPGTKLGGDAFAAELKKVCSGCKLTSVDMQPTDVGTNSASIVASTLQKDPSIDYLFFMFGDLTRGLDAALATAGRTDVKITGLAPVDIDWQALRAGKQTMWISHGMTGYAEVDRLARVFAGTDPVTVSDRQPDQIFTKDNAPASDNPEIPANLVELYNALWHI
jgi:ribose transport system substrate-binding protein